MMYWKAFKCELAKGSSGFKWVTLLLCRLFLKKKQKKTKNSAVSKNHIFRRYWTKHKAGSAIYTRCLFYQQHTKKHHRFSWEVCQRGSCPLKLSSPLSIVQNMIVGTGCVRATAAGRGVKRKGEDVSWCSGVKGFQQEVGTVVSLTSGLIDDEGVYVPRYHLQSSAAKCRSHSALH